MIREPNHDNQVLNGARRPDGFRSRSATTAVTHAIDLFRGLRPDGRCRQDVFLQPDCPRIITANNHPVGIQMAGRPLFSVFKPTTISDHSVAITIFHPVVVFITP